MGKADPKTATITLEEPIVRGDKEIGEIALRRPDAGALRGLSLMDLVRMDNDAVASVLPRISSPPLIDAEVAQLSPADRFACAVEIASFFMKRADLEESRPA